ncbi:MAG: GntR family transcriptional regulator [Micromonosporaceae bacterium]
MISPRSDRAVYRALAEDLKSRIESGELPPGASLPSEAELMRQSGVSRVTARETVRYLRRLGLVVTEKGRGTFVRQPRPIRRLGASRYLGETDSQGGETSSTRDQKISWDEHTLDRDFRVVPASIRQGDLLDLPEGAEVLERRFVPRYKGKPQEISVSCYPYELVKGTPAADPINEPWPGGSIAQLRTLGVAVTRVAEAVSSRRPTPEEADVLKLDSDDPVLVIVRRMFAGDRPVEMADIVQSAEYVQVEYDITIPRSD